MDIARFNDLRTAMRLAGIKPKKGLGQHFLIDQAALEAIVASADVGINDTVLEIGPGLGVMTVVLAERAKHVVAVETDAVLAELLRRDIPANLEVVEADILRYNLSTLPAEYKVVANLPYYLTSKILRLLLEADNSPSVMALLVQKEVAERVCALPGATSMLSLTVQFYAEPKIVGLVERHMFWPQPQVDSAILQLKRLAEPRIQAEPQTLFRLMKAGFGERRKQLKNSLAGGLNCSVEIAAGLLKTAKLKPTARAQELGWGEWERLYRATIAAGLL